MEEKNKWESFLEYFLLCVITVIFVRAFLLFFIFENAISKNVSLIVIVTFGTFILPFFFKKAAEITAFASAAVLTVCFIFCQIKYNIAAELPKILSTPNYVANLTPLQIHVFVCAVSILCVCLFYALSRFRFGLAGMFAAETAIIFIFAEVLKQDYSFSAYLWFSGLCMMLLIIRFADISGTADKSDPEFVPKLMAFAAVICAVSILVSQLLFQPLYNKFGTASRPDITEMVNRFSVFLNPKSNFTGFDDYNPDKRFGKTVSYDYSPVMDVKTDVPFYLRGRVYDVYTGTNWRASTDVSRNVVSADNAFKIPSDDASARVWMLTGISGSGFYMSGSDTAKTYFKKYKIAITMRSSDLHYIMLPLRSNAASTKIPKNVLIVRSYPDMMTSRDIKQGTTYSTVYYSTLLGDSDLSRILPYMKEEYSEMENSDAKKDRKIVEEIEYYSRAAGKAFTSQKNITERTRRLALKITKNCENEFEKAEAIKNWLDENCKYTISPAQMPHGGNFVDYFLFSSKEGYCEHFASAMTVMMRAAGVPARYVEGYASPNVSSNGIYTVTNRQSHAWVEFYSKMFGFVTDDPTPSEGLTNAGINGTAYDQASNAASHFNGASVSAPFSIPSSNKTASSTLNSSDAQLDSDVPSGGSKNTSGPFSAAVIGVITAILLAYFGRSILRGVSRSAIKRKTVKEQVIWYYEYFVSVMRVIGIDKKPSMTPDEFSKIVCGGFDNEFEKVTAVYIKAAYSGCNLNESDLNVMKEFYAGLHTKCRKYMGLIVYIAKHPLL